jgi:hypothetical protein
MMMGMVEVAFFPAQIACETLEQHHVGLLCDQFADDSGKPVMFP